jgi:hypothetical protein
MKRTVMLLLGLCTLAAVTVGSVGPAAAASTGTRCQVRDATAGTGFASADGAALTDAIAAAAAGDRLVVAGTCTGTYTVVKDLTIAGRYPGARRAVLDGGGGTVLDVELEARVRLTDLVLTHGSEGLVNFGTVTAIRTAITGNVLGGGAGAGVLNSGLLTLTRSSVTGNRSTFDGGGIYNTGVGTLVTWRTTIARNTAGGAGGGILDEGMSVLHKSLVTGNVAGTGGGIFANFAQSRPVLDRTRVIGNHPDNCVC